MELGAEISQKIKKTIKKQLKTLGSYVDDELPEYIMVMIANKRTEVQMVDDLKLFLADETDKFVKWLFLILKRLQKAMEFDPTAGIDMEDMDSKGKKGKKKVKNKKKKKKGQESSEEEGEVNSDESEEEEKVKKKKEKKEEEEESKRECK